MTGDDGYAQLWLAELGAWVPEYRRGGARRPRLRSYGMDLPEPERARRNGAQLEHEQRRVRAAGVVQRSGYGSLPTRARE